MTQKYTLLLFGLITITGYYSGIQMTRATELSCPATSAGETIEDCPWAGVTRSLIQASEAGFSISKRLDELLPTFSEQIKKERSQQDMKDAWGTSINFDEGVKATIIDPRILDELIERFGVKKRRDRIVHAGVEHVYGYLFSNLQTSFGFKRARWVKSDIENGFGLKGLMNPQPESGSFFSNITYFISRIAFRTEPRSLAEIKKGHLVAGELKAFDFKKLDITRLQETIRIEEPKRTVVLRTDLVPFLKAPSDPKSNSHLLIYSVLDSKHSGPQLITAFPVASGFVTGALNPENLGVSKTITTRYNAHVEGITGTSFKGAREVLQ
jgi:hypothetical protein